MKKALLVGINYPGTTHALRGCVNDVILMDQIITEGFDFQGQSNGILISGCQSHQTSADAWINGKFQGACTFFISQILRHYGFNVDYKTLVEQINYGLAENGYTQRPELNGTNDFFLKKFLSSHI